jgi:serine protease inhibitor ecotin
MLGPKYDYTNELAAPSQIGVRMGGSFDDVTNAIGGVNYYIDAIGFGASTGIAKAQGKTNRRMGLRYFMNTGMICSNGKDMYEYIDNILYIIDTNKQIFFSGVIVSDIIDDI